MLQLCVNATWKAIWDHWDHFSFTFLLKPLWHCVSPCLCSFLGGLLQRIDFRDSHHILHFECSKCFICYGQIPVAFETWWQSWTKTSRICWIAGCPRVLRCWIQKPRLWCTMPTSRTLIFWVSTAVIVLVLDSESWLIPFSLALSMFKCSAEIAEMRYALWTDANLQHDCDPAGCSSKVRGGVGWRFSKVVEIHFGSAEVSGFQSQKKAVQKGDGRLESWYILWSIGDSGTHRGDIFRKQK